MTVGVRFASMRVFVSRFFWVLNLLADEGFCFLMWVFFG